MKFLLTILFALILLGCESTINEPVYTEPHLIDATTIHSPYGHTYSPILKYLYTYELEVKRNNEAYHYKIVGQNKRIIYEDYLPDFWYSAEIRLYDRYSY